MLSSKLIDLIFVLTVAISLIAWLIGKLLSAQKRTVPDNASTTSNNAKKKSDADGHDQKKNDADGSDQKKSDVHGSDQKKNRFQPKYMENLPTDYDDEQPERDSENFVLATIIFTPHNLAVVLGYEHNPNPLEFNDVMELLRNSAEVWRNPHDGRIKFDNLLRVIDFLIHESKDREPNTVPVHNIGYEIVAKAGGRGPISPLQAAQVLAALSVSDRLELVSLTSARGRRYVQLLRSFVGDSKFSPKDSPRTFFFKVEDPNKKRRPSSAPKS